MTSPITPNPAIHNLPAKVQQQQAVATQQQLQASANQLTQALVKAILQILTGGTLGGTGTNSSTAQQQFSNLFTNFFAMLGISTPGTTLAVAPGSFNTATQLTTWWNSIFAPLGLAANGTDFQTLLNHTYDGLVGTTGSTGKTLTDVFTAFQHLFTTGIGSTSATNASTAISNISTIVSNIVNNLTGLTGTWTVGSEAQPLANVSDTLAANSAAIAKLQQGQSTNNVNGVGVLVDFTTLSNTTNLPSTFTQTYTGTGTGTYGVTNGTAQANLGNDVARSTVAVYNVIPTNTDTQIIGGVWGALPVNDGFGNHAHCSLLGRMNTAGNTYVYAKLSGNSAEIGCVVSGTATSFIILGFGGSGSFNFKTGAAYYLVCGTAGGSRSFQIIENSTVILSYTDTSTSSLGSSFRSCGIEADWPTSAGNINPGQLVYWAMADNALPTTLGSYFRAYRTSTSNTTNSSGNNTFPASWYSTTDRITSDITYNSSTNTATLSIEGTYAVTIRQETVGGNGSNFSLRANLIKNGTIVQASMAIHYPASSVGVGFGGTMFVYCAAGDTITAGYNSNLSLLNYTGDASGLLTYFEIALVNRSLA